MSKFAVWISSAAALVTVIGAVQMGDDVSAWLSLAGRVTEQVAEPLTQYALVMWSIVFFTSLLLTFVLVLRLAYILVQHAAQALAVSWLRLRRRWKVNDLVSKSEALSIIQDSAFYRSRLPSSKRPVTGLTSHLAGITETFTTESKRDRMVIAHFAKSLLREFEDQRSDHVTADGYKKSELEDWLDALFDQEVRKEMGDIPRV